MGSSGTRTLLASTGASGGAGREKRGAEARANG